MNRLRNILQDAMWWCLDNASGAIVFVALAAFLMGWAYLIALRACAEAAPHPGVRWRRADCAEERPGERGLNVREDHEVIAMWPRREGRPMGACWLEPPR